MKTEDVGEAISGRSKRLTTDTSSAKISVFAVNCHLNAQPRVPTVALAEVDLPLEPLNGSTVSKPAIREQLTRIVQSSVFVQSERMSRFLRFIVGHSLDGNQSYLKEYVIGSEVYDRKPPYHPSQDSIVRTEARRLRGKLKEYYATEGSLDGVHIYLRPGSYVPAFEYADPVNAKLPSTEIYKPFSSANTSVVAIAIMPFIDISGRSLSSTYARGIPDELAYTLMRSKRCKVISPAFMECFSTREVDVAAAMSKVGAQVAFEGSVRQEGNRIRVTARIVDADGLQLWAKRFDAEVDSLPTFKFEEQIAAALSQGFDVLFDEFHRPPRVFNTGDAKAY